MLEPKMHNYKVACFYGQTFLDEIKVEAENELAAKYVANDVIKSSGRKASHFEVMPDLTKIPPPIPHKKK